MRVTQIYKEFIELHARRWTADYQNTPIIEYIELHGGPLMTHWLNEKGPSKLLDDIVKKIKEEKDGSNY